MSILILIGLLILIVALVLGFSVMRGFIKMSIGLMKWVIIILVAVALVFMIGGWLGWI
jgi:hypothetical protein